MECNSAPPVGRESLASLGGDLGLEEHRIPGHDVSGGENGDVLQVAHGIIKVVGGEDIGIVELNGGARLDGVVLVHQVDGLVGITLDGDEQSGLGRRG